MAKRKHGAPATSGEKKELYAWVALTEQNATIVLSGLIALAQSVAKAGDMTLFAQVKEAFQYAGKRILYRQPDKEGMVQAGLDYFESVMPSKKAESATVEKTEIETLRAQIESLNQRLNPTKPVKSVGVAVQAKMDAMNAFNQVRLDYCKKTA